MESESQRWASTAMPESAGDLPSVSHGVRHVSTVRKKTTTTPCHGGEQRGTDDVRRGRILQGGRLRCCLHQKPPADTLVSWLSDQTTESHEDIITIIKINTRGASRKKRKGKGVKEGWNRSSKQEVPWSRGGRRRVFFFCSYINLFRSTAWFPACLQSSTDHSSPARLDLWLPGWTAAWWLPHKLTRLSWSMDDDKRRQRKESKGRICTWDAILSFVNVGLIEVATLELTCTLCTSR